MSEKIKTKSKTKSVTLRAKEETLAKIQKIAEANGLSTTDVINLCLASGLNIVESKLSEIQTAAA